MFGDFDMAMGAGLQMNGMMDMTEGMILTEMGMPGLGAMQMGIGAMQMGMGQGMMNMGMMENAMGYGGFGYGMGGMGLIGAETALMCMGVGCTLACCNPGLYRAQCMGLGCNLACCNPGYYRAQCIGVGCTLPCCIPRRRFGNCMGVGCTLPCCKTTTIIIKEGNQYQQRPNYQNYTNQNYQNYQGQRVVNNNQQYRQPQVNNQQNYQGPIQQNVNQNQYVKNQGYVPNQQNTPINTQNNYPQKQQIYIQKQQVDFNINQSYRGGQIIRDQIIIQNQNVQNPYQNILNNNTNQFQQQQPAQQNNLVYQGVLFKRVGFNWTQYPNATLTTDFLMGDAVRFMTKIKVKLDVTHQNTCFIKITMNNTIDHFYGSYKNQHRQWFCNVIWAKMNQNRRYADKYANFEGLIQGKIMRKSQVLGNWQFRHVKIDSFGLKSYRTTNTAPTLTLNHIKQLWTRFQYLQGGNLLVIKLKAEGVKYEYGIPVQSAFPWLKAFYSLLV